MTKIRTLLVDGNSLLKNSFEATKKTPLYNKNLNGVYSFLYKIRKTMLAYKCNRLRIAFDSSNSGSLRTAIYPQYKIHRRTPDSELTEKERRDKAKFKQQKQILKSALEYFVFVYEDKVVEADDVISYYVRNKSENEEIIIVTGDFDIMTLINKQVSVLYLNKSLKNKYKKHDHLLIKSKNFKKYFQFPLKNIILLKTICGDTSDNIANIIGVKETSLFNLEPNIREREITLPELFERCETVLNEDVNKRIKNTANSILKRKCKYEDIEDVVKLNEKLVNLYSDEFITDECIDNLNKIGFLSTKKYNPKSSAEMYKFIFNIGLVDAIKKQKFSIKSFFKPFKKTIDENS